MDVLLLSEENLHIDVVVLTKQLEEAEGAAEDVGFLALAGLLSSSVVVVDELPLHDPFAGVEGVVGVLDGDLELGLVDYRHILDLGQFVELLAQVGDDL